MTDYERASVAGTVKYPPVLGQATSEQGHPYSLVTNTCVTETGQYAFRLRGERAEVFAAAAAKGSQVHLIGRWHDATTLIVDRFDVDDGPRHSYSIQTTEARQQSQAVDISTLYEPRTEPASPTAPAEPDQARHRLAIDTESEEMDTGRPITPAQQRERTGTVSADVPNDDVDLAPIHRRRIIGGSADSIGPTESGGPTTTVRTDLRLQLDVDELKLDDTVFGKPPGNEVERDGTARSDQRLDVVRCAHDRRQVIEPCGVGFDDVGELVEEKIEPGRATRSATRFGQLPIEVSFERVGDLDDSTGVQRSVQVQSEPKVSRYRWVPRSTSRCTSGPAVEGSQITPA